MWHGYVLSIAARHEQRELHARNCWKSDAAARNERGVGHARVHPAWRLPSFSDPLVERREERAVPPVVIEGIGPKLTCAGCGRQRTRSMGGAGEVIHTNVRRVRQVLAAVDR